MKNLISEIQIVPVKPNNGLIAFCSFVLFESLYCSSVAIYTRPEGTYRLVYPTKKLPDKNVNLFYPINKLFAEQILKEVSNKYEEVMKLKNDRYSSLNNQ